MASTPLCGSAPRAQERFFWLDIWRGETGSEALVEALGLPERGLDALRGSGEPRTSRRVRADGATVVFMLRCHVELRAPSDERAYRLRPVDVHVVITREYLLKLHEERISLPSSNGSA